jgi:hypothetical protein
LPSHFALSLLALAFALPLCPLTFGSRFYPPTFALLFQTLSLGIFFFSSRKKEKKKKKKIIDKKKMQRGEGAFLQAIAMPSHFWLAFLPFHFCPYVSNIFS